MNTESVNKLAAAQPLSRTNATALIRWARRNSTFGVIDGTTTRYPTAISMASPLLRTSAVLISALASRDVGRTRISVWLSPRSLT